MSRSLGKNRREVDVDAAAGREQTAQLRRGARRGGRKELLPYLVEVVEVVEVGEEDLRLHRVLQIAAGRLKDAAQVVQDVARLLLDVGAVVGEGRVLPRLGRYAGLVVGGNLAGGIQRLAGEDSLAVMGHRR